MPTWDARNFLVRATLRREIVTSFPRFSVQHSGDRRPGHDRVRSSGDVLRGRERSGSRRFWRPSPSAWVSIRRANSRNFRFATRKSHSDLSDYLHLARSVRRVRDSYFLRAESYFNVATEIEALDPGAGSWPAHYRFLRRQIPARAVPRRIVLLRCSSTACAATASISSTSPRPPCRQPGNSSFLSRLHDLVKDGSQFLIATHSPILLAYPDAASMCSTTGRRAASSTATPSTTA